MTTAGIVFIIFAILVYLIFMFIVYQQYHVIRDEDKKSKDIYLESISKQSYYYGCRYINDDCVDITNKALCVLYSDYFHVNTYVVVGKKNQRSISTQNIKHSVDYILSHDGTLTDVASNKDYTVVYNINI